MISDDTEGLWWDEFLCFGVVSSRHVQEAVGLHAVDAGHLTRWVALLGVGDGQ